MAVFGDFLTPASAHIAAAAAITDLPGPAACGAVHQLNRLVGILSRHLDDAFTAGKPAPAVSAFDRQAAALGSACGAMRRASGGLIGAQQLALRNAEADHGHPAVQHLSAAGTYLTAGRDLLATHFTEAPTSGREPNSYWAPVITSAPVTSALLADLAAAARQLAPWTMRLALALPSDQAEAARMLRADIAPWLWAVGEGIAAAQRQQPPTPGGRRLLAAIPANAAGPRQPPAEAETLSELCLQTVHTSERLRLAAWSFARQARWSQAATSHNWRRGAFASAIIGHSSEIILRTLDARAAQLGADPAIRGQIRAAARAAQRAWDTRRVVAGAWDLLSTGVPKPDALTPVTAELGDLVLRTGRLAHRNPRWTPASGATPLRSPADLAPTAAELNNVLTAVHHTLDAIAKIALEDMETVRTAATDGRIYLPTRNVPAGLRISRRYKPAPRAQIDGLIRLYENVLTADKRALAAAGEVAKALHTPSELLAAITNATYRAQAASPRSATSKPRNSAALAGLDQAIPSTARRPALRTPIPVGQLGGATRTRSHTEKANRHPVIR